MTRGVKVEANSNGIGFLGFLTLVFITLKLLGEISWSWWWVLSPLWIGWAVSVAILSVVALILRIADS